MGAVITVRTDEATEHALAILTHEGLSRSAAIREAVLEAAERRERAAELRRAVLRMDIDLIELGPRIRILAQTVQPVTIRSLDAIHLGTALHVRSTISSFVTYDKRLLDAASAAGLPAEPPA